MKASSARSSSPRALWLALAFLALAAAMASAQTPASSSPFGTSQPGALPGGPFGVGPSRPLGGSLPATSSGASPAPASPVIARIEDRAVTQADFDKVAQPYFAQLRATMGARYTPEVEKTASYNVMDELIRREVLVLEARRQGIEVTESDTDSLLARDPFFLTNGKFDRAKFDLFKVGPTSNYGQMLPQLRDAAAMAKLDQSLRRRFTPSRAEVRAEWDRRNEQVHCRYLPLFFSDVTLEEEATEDEWSAYYKAHPDEFESKPRMRFRYFKLPLPAEGDSLRTAATAAATERARRMADSLRAGTLPDTAAGSLDTGLFDLPPVLVPGINGADELLAAFENADSTARVLGPYTAADAVIVGAIVERQPRRQRPMHDVLPDVRRRANDAKRIAAEKAAPRAYYDAHLDRYRGVRATVERIMLSDASLNPPAAGEVDVVRWYREHGHRLFGQPDSSKAWMPPLNDSLRASVRAELRRNTHDERLKVRLGDLSAAFTARDPGPAAARMGAHMESVTLWSGTSFDSLFYPQLRDSILHRAHAELGVVRGPRPLNGYWTMWRVEKADTAYLPPFDSVRTTVERDVFDQQMATDDSLGRVYFSAHKDAYQSPVRYVVDFVAVPVPPVDSALVPEPELRAYYEKNRASFAQPEQVRPRVILVAPNMGDAKARARADSLRTAALAGADFAELARRLSDDVGSASAGGDLGWRARGQYTQAILDAAFALKPGDIAPVIKTTFGYHIVKLDDRRPARMPPFEEVRAQILNQLGSARADSSAHLAAQVLSRKLVPGRDVFTLTSRYGGVQRSQPISASEPLSDLGMLRGWSNDATRPATGKWAREPYRADHHWVALRVVQVIPSHPGGYTEFRARAVQEAKNAEQKQRFDARVTKMRAAIAGGAGLDSVAAPYGGLRDSGPISRTMGYVSGLGFEPRVVNEAFTLEPGKTSDTLQVATGVAWIRMGERVVPDAKAFEAAAGPLSQELLQKSYDDWLESKKQALKIEVLRPDLRRPRTRPVG